ncbi:MAG TPA: replication-relaxation family protein [Mycobacteriales bacterium]|nr:replication-relaxation family protein [Mycobacteriales bacterium]
MSGSLARSKVDDAALLALAGRLTDRDRLLVELLAQHRVFTTDQVSDLAFGSVRRAEARLAQLYQLRVVDRFRPRRYAGSAPLHWLLDAAGAAVVAADRGVLPTELGWRHDKGLALAGSQHLAHLVGVNGVFTALVRTSRHTTGCQLATWWSERRCAAEWGELVRPDGYGVWIEGGTTVPFLLEYDTGSERLARLAGKLAGYTDLTAGATRPTWVLFRLPSPRREAEARRVLTGSPLRIATATPTDPKQPRTFDPAGPVWLPIGPQPRRLRLGELADPR